MWHLGTPGALVAWRCWGTAGLGLGGFVQDSVVVNLEGFAEKLRVLEFDN